MLLAQGAWANDLDKEEEQKPKVYSERHEDWFYRCIDVALSEQKSKRNCEIVQVAQIKDSDQPVNVLTVAIAPVAGKNSKKQADYVVTILTPLNVHLPSQFSFSVDGRKNKTASYRNCNQAGCWVQIPLSNSLMKVLQRGAYGFGQIRLMNGQVVKIKFSLKGFSSAMKTMKSAKLPE